MLPASGYPLAGCSPAEPASVSPDMFFYMFRASVSILFKDDFWACSLTVFFIRFALKVIQQVLNR
jgi:hypothetical protein